MSKLLQKFGAGTLALAMLAASSCGGEGGTSETTASAETTTEAVTNAEFTPANVDFGGADFNIYLWIQNQLAVETETGDVINDAVYKRNGIVQDLYNVKFKYNVSSLAAGNFGPWYETLSSSILADDNEIQLAGGYGYRLVSTAIGAGFHNLNAISAIDFSRDWWLGNITEAGNLGGNCYFALGNIEPSYYDKAYVMYFNKRIAEENKLENLYELVNNGGWTIEKLAEYSKTATRDLNGDSEMTKDDLYGAVIEKNMCVDTFIQSCDIQITKTNSENFPELIGLTEKYVDVQTFVRDFIHQSGDVFYDEEFNNVIYTLFPEGRALFAGGSIGQAFKYRSMDDDFGIIPYPKYDEAQEEYITYHALGNATTYVVPITADAEKSGAILEALAYYGNDIILPEYYERALKGKGARDNESAEMLDIIFGNIEYDFTQVYSFAFGDQKSPSMLLRMSVKADSDIASMWAADENLYDTTMQTLIDSLK